MESKKENSKKDSKMKSKSIKIDKTEPKVKKELEVVKVKRRHEPTPMFTFDRYFATLGKPAHHKAGMRAYISTKHLKGKKSLEMWEKLFKNY